MLFLRSLLYFLGSIIALIAVAIATLMVCFAPVNIRYAVTSRWAIFCLWWLSITLNIKLNIIGKENIPSKPCIIVSNHQSTLETLAFQSVFPQQTWVLKKELLWIPIFGWGLALLKPVVIDRGKKLQALKKVIKQGSDRLKNGIFLLIFPEGTRYPYGKLGDYQSSSMAIAKKSKSDVIPVYHNAGKVWPKGSLIKHPGTVTIVIGQPIKINEKSITDLTKEVRDWTLAQSHIIR